MKLAGSDEYISGGIVPVSIYVPKPPVLPCRVINSNCSVFCKVCRSTMTRKPFWFGKRSCDNKECKTNI